VTWKQIGLAIVAKIRAFLATGRGKYTAIGGAMVIVFVIVMIGLVTVIDFGLNKAAKYVFG
jgi:preprotein translocase subunit SecE